MSSKVENRLVLRRRERKKGLDIKFEKLGTFTSTRIGKFEFDKEHLPQQK